VNKKLNLSLSESVIESAKRYAEKNNISLSKLIESYLKALTTNAGESNNEITPLVKSLSGVISLENNFDEKEVYRHHWLKKHY
jgi:hypothetical protein